MGHCNNCGGNHKQLFNAVAWDGTNVKYCLCCNTKISNQIDDTMDEVEYECLEDTL
jgi:L-asparaginase II